MMNQKTSIRFTTLILLLVCLCTVPANSKQVTPKKAIAIAKKFVSLNRKQIKLTRAASSNTPYYIYNDQHGQGFVVVAGDDNMGEVLAYSHKGSLNERTASPEVRYLLGAYKQTYQQLKANNKLTTLATVVREKKKSIGPIMNTHWNQFFPYNKQTYSMPTGCVATAMAQIMFHHKWPAQGVGSNKYHSSTLSRELSADFTKSQYKWDKMLPSYGYNDDKNTEACDAVALLMHDIGIAFNMQYTRNGSGAYSDKAAEGMKKHFNYSTSLLKKTNEGTAQFTNIIRNELANSFPVYISGNPKVGGEGHAWVVEGIDEDDLLYMNFGWGGQADGYYSLHSLAVAKTGAEFNGRALTFGTGIEIVLVHPNKEGSKPIDNEYTDNAPQMACKIESTIKVNGAHPTTKQQTFNVSYQHFTNLSQKPFTGDIGLGVYKEDGTLVHAIASTYHNQGGYIKERCKTNDGKLVSGGLIEDEQTFTVDASSLTNGYYYLMPICASYNTDNTYGAWCKMKKTIRLAFEIKDNNIRFYEEPKNDLPFILDSHPIIEKLPHVASSGTIKLYIRKATGMPFDGKVKITLLDKQQNPIATGQTKNDVSFEMFATTMVKIPISIPNDKTAGKYNLKVEVIHKNEANKTAIVSKVHGNEESEIEVAEKKKETILFKSITGMVKDNSSSFFESTNIDVQRYQLITICALLNLADGATCNIPLSLYLEDTKTKKRIDIKCNNQKPYFPPKYPTALIESFWIKPNELNIINNRQYKLILIGTINGKEQNLWTDNCNPCYFSFINAPRNTYPGETTDIKTTTTDCLVNYNSGMLTVQANNIEQVEIFTPNGIKIAEATNNKQPIIKLHIPQNGLKIVKIQTTQGVIVKKIR